MHNNDSSVPETLLHFTSLDAIPSIIEHGFALIPCDRKLLNSLFGIRRPFKVDPQNFGMACFTEAPLNKTNAVRKKGDYAIAMSMEWALKNGVRKVRYINPIQAFLKTPRFKKALQQMSDCIEYPEDGFLKMAYTDKGFAYYLGAKDYAAALDDYEFYQTFLDFRQREWRITQNLAVSNLKIGVRPSPEYWGGHLYYRQFATKDVKFFACRKDQVSILKERLPTTYKEHEIKTY